MELLALPGKLCQLVEPSLECSTQAIQNKWLTKWIWRQNRDCIHVIQNKCLTKWI